MLHCYGIKDLVWFNIQFDVMPEEHALVKRTLMHAPLNVAFTYRISKDTGIIPDDGTVKFDSKVFDSTESFNPNTGEFIAPGCGMYVFMLNIRSNQGKTCWVDIIKDGDSLATAFAESGPKSQLGDTTFVTIYLEKGNTVWAKNHGYQGTVCTIDFYSSFAGFRLF
ncbi:unnamed protein product [Mytilus edulis]|uniref:C1q domain-containing protein n=1 Tax=Mytilus edulis TaxID=6550 RepID=A0A8S3TDC8_MYTED|nr:unnamed protein product [Mytilus edulis]